MNTDTILILFAGIITLALIIAIAAIVIGYVITDDQFTRLDYWRKGVAHKLKNIFR